MKNLFDLIDREDFDRGLDDKLITERYDGSGLRILNYSDAALFTAGAWDNPAVRLCRGLIIDDDWNIVARPWAKFFNHGQPEAGELDLTARVEVTDKMDGSLGIIYRDTSGLARVATRGSFGSDQALHATEVLWTRYMGLRLDEGVTPLVEIVYPDNRIVVDYGDLDDLILIGGVVIDTGEYLSPLHTALIVDWSGPVTQVFGYDTLRDALAAPDRPGMEGLCVRFLGEDRIVKIKQEDYVRLHRIVTGLSERTVWEHMSDGKDLFDLLAPLPDELHEWTSAVWGRLTSEVTAIYNRAHDAHQRILAALGDTWTRKHYAEIAVTHGELRPYLFQILDGRDPRAAILRTLKPAGDTRAKTVSEATA